MVGTHDDATRSGVALVQAGWDIYSKDGRRLGEVIAVNDQLMHLRLEDSADERSLEIGTDTIIEQDQAEMRARISLTADQVAASGV
jgi:hypothetical protein